MVSKPQPSQPAPDSKSGDRGNDEMELLLEQTPWVRRLARRMLIDENSVDDVVQETYLAALQSPPKTSRPVLPWLGTVVRNFVRMGKRGDGRRSQRERSVAAPVEQPESIDPVEETETRTIVAEAVQSLQEPYRSTVFLYFYRELSTPEIARLEGVPANTVRVRLRRALKQLEGKLDSRYDGRRSAWMLALLPFAGGNGGVLLPPMDASASAPLTANAGGPSTRWHWSVGPGLALSIAAVGLLAWFAFDGASKSGATSVDQAGHTHSLSDEQRTPDVAAAAVDRDDAGAPATIAASDESPKDTAQAIASVPLRVVDAATGHPIAGAEIYLRPFSLRSEDLSRGRTAVDVLLRPFATELVGTTNEAGEVRVPAARFARERYVVRADGYREQRQRSRERAMAPQTIALHSAVLATVDVVDADGAPASDVPLRAIGNQGHIETGRSDTRGSFSFQWQDTDYAIEALPLAASHTRVLAELPRTLVALQPGSVGRGRVVDSQGRAVAAASVAVSARSWPGDPALSESDRAGLFETLALPEAGVATVTLAAPGLARQTVSVELPWHDERTFVLSTGASIAGRVFDPIGTPVAQGRVLLLPKDEKFRGRDLRRCALAADGSFTFAGVVPDRYQLLVESSAWEDRFVDLGDVVADTERWESVSLRAGTTVTGHVRFPDGTPAVGVALQIGWICGDELRGPIVTADDRGKFHVPGLWQEAPFARPVNRDLRWTAVLGPEARDIRRALVLEVQRPHDLLRAGGAEVRRFGIYGSRNTCEVLPGAHDVDLVVEMPSLEQTPRFALLGGNGMPVRTVTNLLVIPREDPANGTNLIFGESTGNPTKLHDARSFDGALVGVLSRRYATSFVALQSPFADEVPVQLEPRRTTTIRLNSTSQEPVSDRQLFAAPLVAETSVAAIYIGQTDGNGALDCDFLASGDYDIYVAKDSELHAPLRAGRSVIGLIDLTRIGSVQLAMLPEATTDKAPAPREPVTIFLSSSLPKLADAETERSRSP
ncbi:MAG: sigma-70 family RNA polymerase sigma factor [Planctomycetota bacterium]